MKIRSVYGISEMATTYDIVNGVLLEDKLVEMWPDYPCLHTTTGQHLSKTGICDSWQ